MKKLFAWLLSAVMLLMLVACSGEPSGEENSASNESQGSAATDEVASRPDAESDSGLENGIKDIDSIEELEETVMRDVEDTITGLAEEWEEFKNAIDTFDKYIDKVEDVEAFYDKVNNTAEELCVMLYSYALQYADLIMISDETTDDKYDLFDDLRNCIYEDAADEIHDEIYDGILEDMNDTFYEGVLEDAKDTIPYSDWADARSDEYGWWADARSDVYDSWSDMRSDIYSFCSDIRGELWSNDIVRAEKELEDFRKDVEKLAD